MAKNWSTNCPYIFLLVSVSPSFSQKNMEYTTSVFFSECQTSQEFTLPRQHLAQCGSFKGWLFDEKDGDNSSEWETRRVKSVFLFKTTEGKNNGILLPVPGSPLYRLLYIKETPINQD